ncbi:MULTISPECIES: amidohydrolase family protein [Desulfosediminicola]|uniref:amidohydrolase family protein n=1 Tax=Desulfosediminicola TaxID=2886823 RepID=UPI0010ABC63F|nr:amidohydrolase family protein [Desulfosediminicola ganghwensis]
MKIIDFRFRPNTPEVIEGIKNSTMFAGLCKAINFDDRPIQSLEEIVTELDDRNVEVAVITGRDCEKTYGIPANNGSVLEFCAAYPEKFIGFYGLDPHKGMDAVRELTKAVTELGMKGAAVDPYLAKLYPNDAKYYPIYAKCCELEIPVIFTTGPATLVEGAVMDHVAPRYIDFVARDFPELKIVISHGGYPWVNEAIFVTQRNANVFLEVSEFELSPQADAYIQAANTVIQDQFIFASAHPFVEQKHALEIYESLPFDEKVREKVMYSNAKRLLGL